MPSFARARALPTLVLLAASIAACHRSPTPAPPPPWQIEITSIESETGAGFSRCRASACQPLPEHAQLAAGGPLAPGDQHLAPGDHLRAEHGARVTLTLDPATRLTFRDGTEIAIEHTPTAERTVRVLRGAALVTRRDDDPAAPPILVTAAGRDLVLRAGPTTLAVRAGEGDAPSSAIVHRGRAALRTPEGERLLFTGEGARWLPGAPPTSYARFAAPDDPDDPAAPPGGATSARASAAAGLGTMTARVPGTNEIVSGVRLARHHVLAEVRDGYARTTVEEDFENETSRTLEGRFVFPLPPDASVSRLALYVGDQLVEGEIVDRPLAAGIFRAIVDDTVRPRDPALLEQTTGSTVSLKIFPIPPKGKRKVILAYDQALSQRDEHVRYVYPLSFGPERATAIDDFAVTVTVTDTAAALGSAAAPGHDAAITTDAAGLSATFSAKAFAPRHDFVLAYARTSTDAANLSWSAGPTTAAATAAPGETPAGYFAVRLRADPPETTRHRRWARPTRAFVLDTSHSQSTATLDAALRVARATLETLDPDDRFVLLACDSACATYPEDGLARAGDEGIAAATKWLTARAPAGSSDLAGALLAGAERLHAEGGGQLVYLGDGVPTSGELTLPTVVARVAPALRGLDAHFVGVGHSVDEPALAALANATSATYERFATGAPVEARARQIARTLEAPVLRDARLVLPDGAFDVLPERLPRIRLGQEIHVVGRFRPTLATAVAAGPEAATVPASHRPTVAAGSQAATSATPTEAATVPASHRPTIAAGSEAATVPASHRPDDERDRPLRGPLREVRLTGQVAGEPYEIVRALEWDRALAAPSPAVHALWARARIAALETTGDPAADKEIVRLSTVHHVLSRKTALLVLENERMFVETGVRAAVDRVLAQPAPATAPDPGSLAGHAGPGAASGGAGTAPGASGGDAQQLGLLGVLRGNGSTSASPWGASSGAADPVAARGNLWGDGVGSAAGGLGLSGVGEGGGGRGDGVGLGSVGTVGHGAGTGTGTGFGAGSGRLSGTHKTGTPVVRSGGAAVSGRLPPEVIQRIVRQNFGRFRLCYENGLRDNTPNLAGRVTVRFVIGRDGRVANAGNGGSDLPDANVIRCIVNSFRGLTFPEPEDGIVTVSYPIMFAPEGGIDPTRPNPAPQPSSDPVPQAFRGGRTWSPRSSWSRSFTPSAPAVTHRSPAEATPPTDDPAVAKLLAQAALPGAPRATHQTLVRKLLAGGRFDDAHAAASRYLGLDPDHDTALELYAQTSAATGRGAAALTALDAQLEADPTNRARHQRAAAAFEIAGDERRACAHFRALASLPSPGDAATYHALRCRARLGDPAAALAEARALPRPGQLVTRLVAALEAGAAPAYEPTIAPGSFEVTLTCRAERTRCPTPIVVGPTGTVVSPWTPAAACTPGSLSIATLTSGTYRTLIAGEIPDTGAELTVRALGQTRTLPLTQPGTHLALTSTITFGTSSPTSF